MGLQIRTLSAKSVERVQTLSKTYGKPGRIDLFALALSEVERCPLLTGDAALRQAAGKEQVEVKGTVWLISKMVQQQRITVTLPKAALRKMRANGSDCRGMQLNKCWWRSTWRYLQINKGKNNMANGEPKTKNGNSGNLGFEAEMFKAADKLRGSMEPSDYRHVALGLSFLKYIPMPSRRGTKRI